MCGGGGNLVVEWHPTETLAQLAGHWTETNHTNCLGLGGVGGGGGKGTLHWTNKCPTTEGNTESNLFIMDTKETGILIIEVSVLEK